MLLETGYEQTWEGLPTNAGATAGTFEYWRSNSLLATVAPDGNRTASYTQARSAPALPRRDDISYTDRVPSPLRMNRRSHQACSGSPVHYNQLTHEVWWDRTTQPEPHRWFHCARRSSR